MTTRMYLKDLIVATIIALLLILAVVDKAYGQEQAENGTSVFLPLVSNSACPDTGCVNTVPQPAQPQIPPSRVIDINTSSYTWCILQNILCQIKDVDPLFVLETPPGYEIIGITTYAYETQYTVSAWGVGYPKYDKPYCDPTNTYCIEITSLKNGGDAAIITRNVGSQYRDDPIMAVDFVYQTAESE